MLQHRVYPVIAALVGCALLCADAAAQQSGRRIGVVVTLRVNIPAERAAGLADTLAAALVDELPVETISGREVVRRLPAEGLPPDCVSQAPCRLDVGRRLDADELLFVALVRLGQDIQIDVTWADVASGRVASRPAIELGASDDGRAVFERAAPDLLPHIARGQPDAPGPSIIVVPAGTAVDRGRRVTPGTWIAAGIGAAALVGGTVFALSAQRKYGSLEDMSCRTVMCPAADIDRVKTHALAADVLFATAAASGVVGLVLYLRSEGSGSDAPLPVTVDVGEQAVSLSVGGAF